MLLLVYCQRKKTKEVADLHKFEYMWAERKLDVITGM